MLLVPVLLIITVLLVTISELVPLLLQYYSYPVLGLLELLHKLLLLLAMLIDAVIELIIV